MKILVACEESQTVTSEFRALGHEAYSADILPCSGGHPEWHLQGDVTPLVQEMWDMIIAFPPCTYLTVTGNRWFNVDKYGDSAIQRQKERECGIRFFMMFVNAPCPRLAIENPVGVMSSMWRKPDQIIQPWMFGDPFEKTTCLWLRGMPHLQPTKTVAPPPRQMFASGKSMPSWFADSWILPKSERSRIRSKTFPGIAKAMATQWSKYEQLFLF